MIHEIGNTIKRMLPSPFSIAIILTITIILTALILTEKTIGEIIIFWEEGLWKSKMMAFAMQMMLMLVLGYVIALTNGFKKLTKTIKPLCNNTANAAFLVAFSTIIVSFFNWGLGLIFGAILAREPFNCISQ